MSTEIKCTCPSGDGSLPWPCPAHPSHMGELHQHLLDMLGAKDHVDAGRIIGELHAAALNERFGNSEQLGTDAGNGGDAHDVEDPCDVITRAAHKLAAAGQPRLADRLVRACDAVEQLQAAARAARAASPPRITLLPDDPRIVEEVAVDIEFGKLDHPGSYRNAQLAEALRRVLDAALAARQPVGFDFLAHLQRQREWSERTFGPGDRAAGVVDHIRKELREIESDPSDLAEWIDVAILALDGAWRSGASAEQIIAALVAKQTRNEGRTWPDWRTADPNKAIEHDRSGEVTSAPATDDDDETPEPTALDIAYAKGYGDGIKDGERKPAPAAVPVDGEQLRIVTEQRDLLAKAIGEAAVKSGICRDVSMTGPQLLKACDDMADCIRGAIAAALFRSGR